MVVLGIHLLEVTKKVRVPTLPKGIAARLTRMAHSTGRFAPLMLGAATFFLPCGFTQSMQVVALASGSAVVGALTMVTFALGTLPVLALLSFGSLDLAKSRARGVFFKTAGLLVILFALFNLQGALAVLGIITPILHF
jgi:sulfite exporter TauE/SafE